jgi:hypothetical protein
MQCVLPERRMVSPNLCSLSFMVPCAPVVSIFWHRKPCFPFRKIPLPSTTENRYKGVPGATKHGLLLDCSRCTLEIAEEQIGHSSGSSAVSTVHGSSHKLMILLQFGPFLEVSLEYNPATFLRDQQRPDPGTRVKVSVTDCVCARHDVLSR